MPIPKVLFLISMNEFIMKCSLCSFYLFGMKPILSDAHLDFDLFIFNITHKNNLFFKVPFQWPFHSPIHIQLEEFSSICQMFVLYVCQLTRFFLQYSLCLNPLMDTKCYMIERCIYLFDFIYIHLKNRVLYNQFEFAFVSFADQNFRPPNVTTQTWLDLFMPPTRYIIRWMMWNALPPPVLFL